MMSKEYCKECGSDDVVYLNEDDKVLWLFCTDCAEEELIIENN